MSIAYRDAAGAYVQVPGTNTGSLQVTIPATAQAGDTALFFFVGDTPSPGITEPPSGWARVRTPITSSGPASAEQSFCWYRRLTAGQGGSTVSVPVGANDARKMLGQMVLYSGALDAAPAVSAVAEVGTTTQRTTPTVAGATTGSALIEFVCDRVGSNISGWNVPAAMTNRGQIDGGQLLASVCADLINTSGTVGGHTYTKTSGLSAPQAHMWSVVLSTSAAATKRLVVRRLTGGVWS